MTSMQQRRGFHADFVADNPILDAGEPGYEIDTKVFKIGDGVTHWNSLVEPYLKNVVTTPGDFIVMVSGVQLLINPSLSADVDVNGVADNWVLYGDSITATLDVSGQKLHPAPTNTSAISQVVTVVAGHVYTFTSLYTTRTMSGGQVVFKVEWFSDFAATTLINYSYSVDATSNHTATFNNDWTAPAGAIRCKVSMSVEGGGDATFAEVSFSDAAALRVARVPRGTLAQTLVVKSDGTLGWDDIAESPTFMLSSEMPVYETLDHATTDHEVRETIVDAAATYETITHAATQEALLETVANAALVGALPANMVATYQPITTDKVVVKSASQTVTNSAVLVADTELLFPVVAGGVYIFEMVLYVQRTGASDCSAAVAINGPAGITTGFGIHAPNLSPITDQHLRAPAGGGAGSNAGPVTFGLIGPGYPVHVVIRGTVFVGGTAGNVGLSFAQSAAVASVGVLVDKVSYLHAMRVS